MICQGDELIFYSAQNVPSKARVLKITQYTCCSKRPVQDDVPLLFQLKKSVLARRGTSAY